MVTFSPGIPRFVADIVATIVRVCDFRHQEVPKKEKTSLNSQFTKIAEFLVKTALVGEVPCRDQC